MKKIKEEKRSKIKEEKLAKSELTCNKNEVFKILGDDKNNYYCHNSKDLFILKKSEIKTFDLYLGDYIKISNSVIKETNGVKEIILPAMSSVSQVKEKIDVVLPEAKVLTGTVGFKTENKIFLNTRKGIIAISNKEEDFIPSVNLSYQFFFIEENKYKGRYTTKHSFFRKITVDEFGLTNEQFVCKNIDEQEVDSYHYVEGSLIECAYLKNESVYHEEKTLWGIFKILDKNTNKIVDVSMVHEAFKFFKIDFDSVDKGDFKQLRELIDKYFSERENRASVRFLVKVTMRKSTGTKQFAVHGVQRIL